MESAGSCDIETSLEKTSRLSVAAWASRPAARAAAIAVIAAVAAFLGPLFSDLVVGHGLGLDWVVRLLRHGVGLQN